MSDGNACYNQSVLNVETFSVKLVNSSEQTRWTKILVKRILKFHEIFEIFKAWFLKFPLISGIIYLNK